MESNGGGDSRYGGDGGGSYGGGGGGSYGGGGSGSYGGSGGSNYDFADASSPSAGHFCGGAAAAAPSTSHDYRRSEKDTHPVSTHEGARHAAKACSRRIPNRRVASA